MTLPVDPALLSAVWDEGPDDFVVMHVDPAGRRSLYTAHHRAWSTSGWHVVRHGLLEAGASASPRLRRWALPVVVLAEEPERLAEPEILALGTLPRARIVVREGDVVIHEDRELHRADAHLRHRTLPNQVTLTLEAGRALVWHHLDLPSRHPVELRDQPGAERRIRVSAQLLEGEVPRPAWFFLPPDLTGRFELEVGVLVRPASADTWRLVLHAGDARHELIPCNAPIEGLPLPPPDRLLVVLDRTAPDERHWEHARHITVTGGTMPVDRYGGGARTETSRAGPVGSFNEDIIEGLLAALEGLPLRVDLFAVGDSTDAKLIAPDHTPLGEDVVPVGLDVAPGGVRAHAGSLSYVPGLDLWDPLEKGLDAALSRADQGTGRCAVLIVGNSPPTPHASRDGAFADLIEGRLEGFPPTTVRRKSGLWRASLARAEASGVPLAYVFATYRQRSDFPSGPFQRFQRLQEIVRERLASEVPLIASAADTPGILEGVRDAMERFQRPSAAATRAHVRRWCMTPAEMRALRDAPPAAILTEIRAVLAAGTEGGEAAAKALLMTLLAMSTSGRHALVEAMEADLQAASLPDTPLADPCLAQLEDSCRDLQRQIVVLHARHQVSDAELAVLRAAEARHRELVARRAEVQASVSTTLAALAHLRADTETT